VPLLDASASLTHLSLSLSLSAPGLLGKPPSCGVERGVGLDFLAGSGRAVGVTAGCPESSNRRVAELAGFSDQGQISRLVVSLCGRGLLENVGGQGQGAAKAWHLTHDGDTVTHAYDLPAGETWQAAPALRLTALTYMVPVDAAGARATSQISRLLARLRDHVLLQNTAGPDGGANVCRLTSRGREIVHTSQVKELTR
jgi:hypothetical protein